MDWLISYFQIFILIEWAVIFGGWAVSLKNLSRKPAPIYKVDNPWKCRNYGILAFLTAVTGILPFGKFPFLIPWLIILISFLFSFSGPILYYWARFHLKKHWSSEAKILENHQLITSGPYSFVRHPIYLSKIVLGFAAAIIFNSWLVMLLATALILSAVYQARIEENLLRKYFGENFAAYSKKTPFLFPNPLRFLTHH